MIACVFSLLLLFSISTTASHYLIRAFRVPQQYTALLQPLQDYPWCELLRWVTKKKKKWRVKLPCEKWRTVRKCSNTCMWFILSLVKFASISFIIYLHLSGLECGMCCIRGVTAGNEDRTCDYYWMLLLALAFIDHLFDRLREDIMAHKERMEASPD